MKPLKLKEACVIGFIFFLPLIASAEIHCPPTNVVRNVHFIRADGAAHIWDLFAEPFHYEDRDWEVLFTVYLPSANNNQEALQQGDEFYKLQVDFFERPMGRENEERQVCYYAHQESSYFVRAISPTK